VCVYPHDIFTLGTSSIYAPRPHIYTVNVASSATLQEETFSRLTSGTAVVVQE